MLNLSGSLTVFNTSALLLNYELDIKLNVLFSTFYSTLSNLIRAI